MKIRRIAIKVFKRFTNTTIENIPETAKLVMLVGPNGSGKSSLIDAVYNWYSRTWAGRGGWDESYHAKQTPGATVRQSEAVRIEFFDPQPRTEADKKKAIYVRSAYRNDPEFDMSNLTRTEPAIQEHRFSRLIENDQAVSRNYTRLVSQGFEDVFELADANTTVGEFREELIGEIRDAMANLFPGLVLNSLGNPLTSGTFKFDKGDSKAFLYKNLSGGEKAAFDLLLDLLIKRREFNDTVFFIDEPEAHMGARLQGDLLAALVDLVPDNSQIWLATHSIGMMRRAKEIGSAHPGQVAFLDFDGRDFDAEQVLTPMSPDRPFWKRALQIALHDLADFVAPERVLLCEGGQFNGGKREFDADCYNSIFQLEFAESVFVGAGNATDVEHDRRALRSLLRVVSEGSTIIRLIDRDDRTDDQIAALNAQGVRVLSLRTIESYLLSDEVLAAFCAKNTRPELAEELLAAKAEALRASVARGNPPDDLKSASGEIYNAARRLFPEQKLGSDSLVFMKAFCAPLVTPGTATYTILRRDVFGL